MTTSVPRRGACEREQRRELCLPFWVDTACRLVEHEQLRVGDEHRGQREPLPLARREVARVALEVVAEPDLRDRFARPRLVGAERDLVEHALRDEVTPGILAQVRRAGVPDLARRRVEQPGRDLGQRRLPGAVRTGQRDDLAAANLERRTVERDAVAVGEADVAKAADGPVGVRQVARMVRGEPVSASSCGASSVMRPRSMKSTRSA